MLSVVLDDDDGVIAGGDGFGYEMARAGGVLCSWWRGDCHSVVTSATAALALDSSTMALLVA